MFLKLFALFFVMPQARAATMPAAAATPDATTAIHLTSPQTATPDHPAWSGDFNLELRSAHDLRDRPENKSQDEIHEISVGGRYRFDNDLSVEAEFSVEPINGQSTFFAKRALIDWSPFHDVIRLRLGQQFLPVGLINERDNWFSSNPAYMQKLFAQSKGIDLGAVADVYPWAGHSLIYAEAGTFAGRFVREEDQRAPSPEIAPRVLSLKSHSAFHDAFATYYEHHLAFSDPLKAWGAGFEARLPGSLPGFSLPVQGRLLSEYWRIDQLQAMGPLERDQAFLIYGELDWWRLSVGYRWNQTSAETRSALGREALPLSISRLWMLEYHIRPEFSLRAERVSEVQSEVLRDDWVARALIHWQM